MTSEHVIDQPRETAPPQPQQSPRDEVIAPRAPKLLRLEDCGDVLTLEELAAVRRISVRTLQRELHDGTCPVPALRHGRKGRGCKWTFARAAVARYLETGETWQAHRRGLRRAG